MHRANFKTLTNTKRTAVADLKTLVGDDPLFVEDKNLKPVIEDDPLLREPLFVCIFTPCILTIVMQRSMPGS
jgi:hypothetical protein